MSVVGQILRVLAALRVARLLLVRRLDGVRGRVLRGRRRRVMLLLVHNARRSGMLGRRRSLRVMGMVLHRGDDH